MPMHKFKIIIGTIIGVSCVIIFQNFHTFIDISKQTEIKPSKALKSRIQAHQTPIKITIFSSQELLEELNVSSIHFWLKSLSDDVSIAQINPLKHPQQSDHYDITSDGIFVIEANSKRIDIDLIELILKNSDFSIETLQNHLMQALLNIINFPPKSVLFVHTSPNSILSDDRPLGLNSLAKTLERNHIKISEINVADITNLNETFDATIFYKIGPNATPNIQQLQQLYNDATATIFFSHPKYALIANQIIDHVQFNSEIIEDPTFHLMNSKNQLITDYQSHFNEPLIALLPYSSIVSFEDEDLIQSIVDSSPDSFIQFDSIEIKGPFSIIAHDANKQRYFINNHLLPTNFWIQQANNQAIVEDIIFSTLSRFPVFTSFESTQILLTKSQILSFVIAFIIVPFFALYTIYFGCLWLGLIRWKNPPSSGSKS
ncbi:MAG: hypothetical protein VW397_05265 [Candidatus Margulisiibacteriota bacterium]